MVYVQEANAKGMKLADPSDYDLFPARFEVIVFKTLWTEIISVK